MKLKPEGGIREASNDNMINDLYGCSEVLGSGHCVSPSGVSDFSLCECVLKLFYWKYYSNFATEYFYLELLATVSSIMTLNSALFGLLALSNLSNHMWAFSASKEWFFMEKPDCPALVQYSFLLLPQETFATPIVA